MRGATFALWALAAASAAYWGLKVSGRPPPGSATPVAARAVAPPDPSAVAALLGANPASPAAAAVPVASMASRFALVGVAAHSSGHGAALIAIDGQPPKPYRVGSRIEEGLVLQSVQGRQARLGASASGPALVTLELPEQSPIVSSGRPAMRPPPGPPVMPRMPTVAPGMQPQPPALHSPAIQPSMTRPRP